MTNLSTRDPCDGLVPREVVDKPKPYFIQITDCDCLRDAARICLQNTAWPIGVHKSTIVGMMYE